MKKKTAESWLVYILRCADDSLYTGITNDLQRRCRQHNEGKAFSLHPLSAATPAGLSGTGQQSQRSSAAGSGHQGPLSPAEGTPASKGRLIAGRRGCNSAQFDVLLDLS